jgi:hypothetical protein
LDRFLLTSLISLPVLAGKQWCALFFRNRKPCFSQQLRENHPEESIPPMQMRPFNFPVENGQLLTQREVLCRERGSGHDEGPDEHNESGGEDHKCEANHRKKDEPDDQAEWLMISLTTSISRPDEVFGRDSCLPGSNSRAWSSSRAKMACAMCTVKA